MSAQRLPSIPSPGRTTVKIMENTHFSGRVLHISNPSMTALRRLEFSSASHLEFYILSIQRLRVLGFWNGVLFVCWGGDRGKCLLCSFVF